MHSKVQVSKSPRAPLTAHLARDRATETVLIERPSPGTSTRRDVLIVVSRPQRGGLVSVSASKRLGPDEVAELTEIAFGGSRAGSVIVDVAVAREVIARGVLATRLAGRREPEPLRRAAELLPNLDHAISRVVDLFVCPGCGAGLPGGVQIALARGRAEGPISCESCDGDRAAASSRRAGHVPRWIAVAQLMIDAGEPRRALALTARAEHDGATGPVLDRLRGWAHLALSNPTQAAAYLRHALEAEPWELRTRTLLVIADAQASLVSSAVASLDAIEWLPGADAILEPTRRALAALGRGDGGAEQVRVRCLAALRELEAEGRARIMMPHRTAPRLSHQASTAG